MIQATDRKRERERERERERREKKKVGYPSWTELPSFLKSQTH